MRKIIGIGETVLDIIFKDSKPIEAVPGGSTFNAITSLGRCGVSVFFISEAGDDRVGRYILSFLKDNGVDTGNVNMSNGFKSSLSLAFLNEHNDAEYIFYKDEAYNQLDFKLPDIQADDIILFGSYYAVNPMLRAQIVSLLDYARSKKAIIYYDVNFRPSHRDEVIKITPNLLENFDYADIVRGSKEDFETLYKLTDGEKVFNSYISFYCKRFIYTQGANPIEVRGDHNFAKSYPVISSNIVSTVGAGDNFNAGFIYGLLKYHITKDILDKGLTEEQWDALVACGQRFSEEACKGIFNYVSKDFGKKMQIK